MASYGLTRSLKFFVEKIVLGVCLSFFANCWAADATKSKPSLNVTSQGTLSPQLEKLSQKINGLQTKLKQKGIDKIFIGGGSALSILEHFTNGAPLEMRDLDIFIVANKEVTESFAKQLGEFLESKLLGKFSTKDLRPRPRKNPKMPAERGNNYNAGFGFFLDKEGQVIDLSIFHSKDDLKLNGIFDIDTVMIPLTASESLTNVLKKSTNHLPIHDENKGWESWKNRHPKIVNWPDVEKDPPLMAFRIVRTFAKVGKFKPDLPVMNRLTSLIRAHNSPALFQLTRSILKVLDDDFAVEELKLLAQLKVFDAVSPALGEFLRKSSEQDLKGIFLGLKAPDKLIHLLSKLPVRSRLPFIKPLLKIDIDFALSNLEKLFTPLNSSDKALKLGYYSGEFAPFHNGHLGVANAALQNGLDFLFIVPTPFASNDPKTPHFDRREWQERIDFSKLATGQYPHLIVYPQNADAFSPNQKKLNLADVLAALKTKLELDEKLTHVAGGDSFYRIVSRNLLTEDPRPRMIIDRPGVPNKDINIPYLGVRLIDNPNRSPISATEGLHKLALGLETPEFNPAVRESLLTLPRYKKIFRSLLNQKNEIQSLVRKQKKTSDCFLDTRRSYAGLWTGLSEHPDSLFEKIILELLKEFSEIKVWLTHHDPEILNTLTFEWEEFIKSKGWEAKVKLSLDKSIERPNRTIVIDAGKATHDLENDIELLKKGVDIRVYENPNQPSSELFRRTGIRFVDNGGSNPKKALDACPEIFSP